MRALGFDVPKPELVNILQTHGVPATTTTTAGAAAAAAAATATVQGAAAATPTARLLLPFVAFQHLMARRILERDPKEEILRAFQLFDDGQKGKIDLEDLRRVARELGEGLGEEELVAMIEEFDLDGDGAISRDEFLAICLL